MIKKLSVLSTLLFALCVSADPTTQPAEPSGKKSWDKAPVMQVDVAKTYTATVETSKGKIVLALFAKDAPRTVNSFVFLAKQGFYNGVIFHRVIPGFMIQGGDPTGTGGGGPGYEFENENKQSARGFTKGTLGMANAGMNTNGSQFFIMHADYGLEPSKYTIFGEVKEGQNVVDAIATTPTNGSDKPNEDVVIKSVTIEEK